MCPFRMKCMSSETYSCHMKYICSPVLLYANFCEVYLNILWASLPVPALLQHPWLWYIQCCFVLLFIIFIIIIAMVYSLKRISCFTPMSHVWRWLHILECNDGGGGGNFSKVKQLVAKWIGTRKRLFSRFLHHGCDFRKARTFSQGIFYS